MATQLTITQIPPLPTIMLSLLRFDPGNPENDASALERLLLPDKGASADILRVANSAYYGRSGKIKDLKGAITLMGVKGVKNLVVLLSTKNLQGKLKSELFQRNLTLFPVLAALVAVDISKPAGHPALRDDAFVASLLCKMGMTVIAMNAEADYGELLKAEGDIMKAEMERFGTDHVAVGRDLFTEWKLPEQLVEVLNGHAGPVEGITSPLIRITALAMQYAGRMLELPAQHNQERTAALEKALGLSKEVAAGFGADYFENIQTHPFFEQAQSG